MQINAFMLLVPLEVVLVKMKFFLFQVACFGRRRKKKEYKHITEKKNLCKSHGIFLQISFPYYSVSQSLG